MRIALALCLPIVAALMFCLGASGAALADGNNLIDGVALHGFDPVAYFTEQQAVKGDPEFTASHDGATYEFASKESQAAFQAEPAKYVPQFGGFCAFGVSEGYKADIDPHAFTVSDGKLYLNYSEPTTTEFRADLNGRITKAEKNWPGVVSQTKVIR